MHIELYNRSLASGYKSPSQIARVLSENWFKTEMYCPSCSNNDIKPYLNNFKAVDFACPRCGSLFQAKSSKNEFRNRVVDGEYNTMTSAIHGDKVPNFLFMHYSRDEWVVKNLFIIPNFFFSPSSIEKRKPLSPHARRAGWTGCNILLDNIPESGRIFVIKNERPVDRDIVRKNYSRLSFLGNREPLLRGWTLDVLNCVESLGKSQFTLKEVYAFEKQLQPLHPDNTHIKDKIRQQLQILRDKKVVGFNYNGTYELLR